MAIKTVQTLNLGELLIDKGLISLEQFDEARKEREKNPFEKLSETFLRLKLVAETDLLSAWPTS